MKTKLEYRSLDYDVWDKGTDGIFKGFRRYVLRLVTS